MYGVPERIRTSDLQFRKPLLYPAELRGHISLVAWQKHSADASPTFLLYAPDYFLANPAAIFAAYCNTITPHATTTKNIKTLPTPSRLRFIAMPIAIVLGWAPDHGKVPKAKSPPTPKALESPNPKAFGIKKYTCPNQTTSPIQPTQTANPIWPNKHSNNQAPAPPSTYNRLTGSTESPS